MVCSLATTLNKFYTFYQEANQTVLSTIETEEMLASIKIDATLKKEMLEVFERLKHIMHSWK